MRISLAVASVLCGMLMGSCVDTSTLAEGGMTGTGIAYGRITGFGSIYVNGIHYNVDAAQFYRDGATASGQGAFVAGEFVTVTGTVGSDGVNGIAERVVFDSLLKGEVTAVSTDGNSLVVLGQTVQTDLLTVLHGFTQLGSLQLGNVLEVSGVRDAAGVIQASSLALLADTPTGLALKLEGVVSGLQATEKTFRLGGLTVDYATASLGSLGDAGLVNGQYVQVEASSPVQGTRLVASKVSGKSRYPAHTGSSRLEIEGLISAVQDASHFTLAGQAVAVTASTRLVGLAAANLTIGRWVEVEGTVVAGVLQASEIVLRQADAGIRLQGQITAIDTLAQTLTLQGETLHVDNASMLLSGEDMNRLGRPGGHHGVASFADLKVGDYIEVNAIRLADGSLQVLRLDRGGRPR